MARTLEEQRRTDARLTPLPASGKLAATRATGRTERRRGRPERGGRPAGPRRRRYARPLDAQDLGAKTDTEEHHP